LNNAGCGFDGGDCCGPDVRTLYCSECECLGENITSKAAHGPFCSCSVENTIGCEFIDLFSYNNLKQTKFNLNFQGCEIPGKVDSGYCNDDTNTEECNYDGGDCCGTNVNRQYCFDCICYPHETCDGPLDLISDGYCNDETNNAGCNFDGGDCCDACANTDQCSDCVCHEGGATAIDTSCKYSRFLNRRPPGIITKGGGQGVRKPLKHDCSCDS
jgi:hypothetical protein